MSTTTIGHGTSGIAESETRARPKILVIDDDESVRNLLRLRLSETYDIVDTGDPEEGVAMALEHKPDAILLDLMMPKFSGFELCQTLHSLSYTSRIPIYVVTGESGEKYREYCTNLGARGYFHKPIDFPSLKGTLAGDMKAKLPERRKHKRVQMRVPLKLRGTDTDGVAFDHATTTDNVSAGGFLAPCPASLMKGTPVEVFVTVAGQDQYAGRARTVRKESGGSPWQRYGFEFLETTSAWVLIDS